MGRHFSILLSALLPWLPMEAARAQAPVRIVVPYPAGGALDVSARALASGLSSALGGALVTVDNVPGGSGLPATQGVAQSPPDGQTLLMHQNNLAFYPGMIRSTSYDPLRQFEPLGIVSEIPMVVVGKPALAAGSVADLARIGPVVPATVGPGSSSHFCAMWMAQTLGLSVRDFVHYRGTAPALMDLAAGQTDVMCVDASAVAPQIAAGQVKRLGQTAPPVSNWYGLYAPAGTPANVVARLNSALRTAARSGEFAAAQQRLAGVVVGDERASPEGHRQFLQREMARWTPLVRTSDVTIEMPPPSALPAARASAGASPGGGGQGSAEVSRGGSGRLD